MRACVTGGICVVIAAATLLAGAATPRAQQPAAAVCDLTTSERIVAVGDVHGAHDRFVAILRAAGLIDARDRWIGGRATFVQTGDVFDRGDDSRKTMDLLRRLEREARNAGGRVLPLLGNHEVMRLAGDWRYVSAGEFQGFRNAESVELRETVHQRSAAAAETRARNEGRRFDAKSFRDAFFKEIPLGYLEMRLNFAAGSEYGEWIRSRQALARINNILFVHGGISAEVATLGCPAINNTITAEMRTMPVPPEKLVALFSSRETGPLWYRGLADDGDDSLDTVAATLKQLQARAIVIGHTVSVGRIKPRFDGRVIQIDTGMLGGKFYPGGEPAALEIVGDTLTAIYLNRRDPLGKLPTS